MTAPSDGDDSGPLYWFVATETRLAFDDLTYAQVRCLHEQSAKQAGG